MNDVSRSCRTALSRAAIVASCIALVASPSVHAWPDEPGQGWPYKGWPYDDAASWPSEVARTHTLLEVERESLSAAPHLAYVTGGWFRYTHASSAPCSAPPRACYAKAQRIYYLVDCVNGSLARIQRLTFDLNGDVSSQSDVEYGAPFRRARMGSLEQRAVRMVCTGRAERGLSSTGHVRWYGEEEED